jgi:hypothetical protein
MIDNEALDRSKERVRIAIESLDECERAIAYSYLFNLGERVDGIERKILSLAPRKACC